ncbi:MCM family protein [Nitzschia inconspicua]|uniref:MCM family protein n=1 Tax=Nitzschia inconspicua TaxID=303405 RepID=A0A9K3PZA6_9STRA|nr:MCM family protein [Nitzschia inconspicua]
MTLNPPPELDPHQDTHRWTAERLWCATYQDLGSPQQVQDRFQRHLLKTTTCRQALHRLLQHKTNQNSRDYSLELDAFEILQTDPVLGHLLLRFPNTLVPVLEKSIVSAQRELKRQLEEEEDQHNRYNENNNSNNRNVGTDFENDISDEEGEQPSHLQQLSVKGESGTRVHGRIVHLPPSCCRTSIAAMEATDVGKIIQLSGTCVRTGPVQMYESARTYKCTGKKGCSRTFIQYADLEERHNAMVVPERCTLFLENGMRCSGTNLRLQEGESVHTDYQEIKIQEQAAKLSVGNIPRSLMIKLQHDLVDTCHPGDEIVVVGNLLAQWQQSAIPGLECQVGMALKAHSVRVVQENGASAWQQTDKESSSMGELEKFKKEFDTYWEKGRQTPIASRNFICKAICPKLYGLTIIKLALLITLIGGVAAQEKGDDEQGENYGSKEGRDHANARKPQPFRVVQSETSSPAAMPVFCDNNYNNNTTAGSSVRRQQQQQNTTVKTKRRDMSHMLLIGDPGTGKSQILRFAAALCPRAVLTTGVGTTSAGLTCAAVREGNDRSYSLEAGALVLADKSVCCIDEFGCIRNEDRLSILEALEQQSISVAKAGIVCKLQCRATVIGVMNPRNCIYDNQQSLSQNTGLGTPLLSRFDLIFKMVDSSDPARDEKVTHYLLDRAIVGAGFECANSKSCVASEDIPWSIEKLRAYIAIVKERFQPEISEDAAILLERHYRKVRSAQTFTIPVTVRFLESLIRLTQAHARLMYRDVAELEDAVAVLRVMECSAYAYGGFDGDVPDSENVLYCDPLEMDTPNLESPDDEFLVFQYHILNRYDMLDRMDENARNKVVEYLRVDTNNGQDWRNIDHPRDTQANIFQDHYGRSYFSPAPKTPTGKRRRF